jgi:hypothetical protein
MLTLRLCAQIIEPFFATLGAEKIAVVAINCVMNRVVADAKVGARVFSRDDVVVTTQFRDTAPQVWPLR